MSASFNSSSTGKTTFTSPLPGYFGSLTETAVEAFQSATGIVSSGTPQTSGYGQVGPQTRAKIGALTVSCQSGITASQLLPRRLQQQRRARNHLHFVSYFNPTFVPVVSPSYGGGGEGGGGGPAPTCNIPASPANISSGQGTTPAWSSSYASSASLSGVGSVKYFRFARRDAEWNRDLHAECQQGPDLGNMRCVRDVAPLISTVASTTVSLRPLRGQPMNPLTRSSPMASDVLRSDHYSQLDPYHSPFGGTWRTPESTAYHFQLRLADAPGNVTDFFNETGQERCFEAPAITSVVTPIATTMVRPDER